MDFDGKMTSVDRKVRVKGQKSEKPINDESTRAFLNFSRENLNVSQSDIEQGFNRNSRCWRINRQMLLSLLAIFLAVVCLACEGIKIKKIVDNSRAIEIIREDLESLKSRIYEENFFDELRAFEQLYADEEDDLNEADLDENYLDSNYDDYETSQSNYPNDHGTTSSINSTISSELINNENVSDIPGNSSIHFDDKNSNKTRHVKRFVAEEPSHAHQHGRTQFDHSISPKNDKNRNKKNSLISTSTIFPKKRRVDKQKMSEMTKVMKNRRHVRPSRQIFAAHYGADTSMFDTDVEHSDNGRSKHNAGVFKAWTGSHWMGDLGMNRYFSLARDGRLTVHEAGLYLVYAQIHYLDEHDENGFHLLVNGHPILQCMIYSPGIGHKSRSCFSAQVTYLSSGDHIILKEVGEPRYTLFQADKSFFGLAKLGEIRQPHQNQTRHSTQSQQDQTRPFQ